MKKLLLLLCVVFIPAFFFSRCTKRAASNGDKPNIVILFVDDMGYGDLQCYGNPTIRTPNIDRLAQQGIRFTSYEAAPWCEPSRAELMTGRYYPRIKFGGDTGANGKGGLPDNELTLAQGLKEAGYATGMAGKWHLGYDQKKFLPTNKGFDSWLGLPYSNDYKPPYFPTDIPLVMYRDTTVAEYPVDQDSLTVKYTSEAIRFIRKQSQKNKPFFFYLAYNMPHLPIHTTKEFLGKSGTGLYGDVVETIDWSVGQVLKTLHDEGLSDNTIVFFASDNGPWLNAPPRMFNIPKHPEGDNWELRGAGNKHWYIGSPGPLRGSKHTTYEGGTRVPAMIRWPGHIKPDRVSDALVTNLDIFQTFLKAGGGKDGKLPVDGYDVMPFLTGKTDKDPRSEYAYFLSGKLEALRVGRWKLRLADKHPQLFELQRDPSERYNVAEENPDVVRQLREQMQKVANDVGVGIVNNGE